MCILKWEDIEQQIKNTEASVLLGNGFSMSYQMPNFNQVEIIKDMPTLKDLTEVSNIEICIKDTVKQISNDITNNAVPKHVLEKWITAKLRQEFVETLFRRLPKSLKDIDGYDIQKVNSYKHFFSLFNNTFTLNYDPLIYWMFLNFTNYGEQDFLELIDLKETMEKTEISSSDYKKIEKKFLSKTQKCQSNVRKGFLKNYIDSANVDYKVKVFYKDDCLMDETLGNAKFVTSSVFEKVYSSMVADSENLSETVKNEKENIDKCVGTSINNKTHELKVSQTDFNIKLFDGFVNNKKWKQEDVANQTLYFLHGALHLVENFESTEKIQADDDGKMLDNIEKAWQKGYESLIVLEGSAQDKKNRIASSPYLKSCFESFENIKGNLVSFGLAFEDSDNHIVEAINNNPNLENIYIGGFTEKEINEKIKPKFHSNPKVKYFITKDFFEIIKKSLK